jgi:hypothetical protein
MKAKELLLEKTKDDIIDRYKKNITSKPFKPNPKGMNINDVLKGKINKDEIVNRYKKT